ncbi:hypothetical protein BGW39_005301 [Mortierella sp. 14UC]|nr:hypothetical protein BGW39_005301 [Mortierella sp. 14UC]
MAGLSLPGSNPAVSSRGAASFVPRKLSTAVAIEPNNDDDLSPYSSGYDHSRAQEDPRFSREPITASSRSSGSGSFKAGEGEGSMPHFTTRSTVVSSSNDGDNESTATATSVPSNEPSTTQHHTKPSSSWRFPTTKGPSSHFSENNPPNPLEPVQTWPSTANALSELYKSLHQINSASNSTTAGRSTALRSALLHYNYLSRLQSMYDTILIPRRHTRTLFLRQGREPKTRDNLEQLLRITMDLIWLNEKERLKKRRPSSSSSKLGPAVNITAIGSAASASPTKPTSDTYPHVYSPADDYHGLRVSEYTVLMNWIGSVTGALGTHFSPTNSSSPFSSSVANLSTFRPGAPQRYQHPISQSGPVDQAWAIWQDFLLTGMKPDVVLYTMLMDTLLKAKEFDRADQIWNHMQRQDSSTGTHSGGKLVGLGAIEFVPRSFHLGGTSANAATAVGLSNTTSRSTFSFRSKKRSDTSSPNTGVVPNLQTFSVLMQSHIQQSDIDGVARTYKQLHQTTLSRDQQRPINTVLVNQILKVLVDLGETDAAREIFAEMRVDNGDVRGTFASGEEKYTNKAETKTATGLSPMLSTLPIHHQTSRRRASWKRENRRKQRILDSETTPTTATTLTSGAGAGLSIRPNEATCRLMLQVARREMDSELESQVLKELRRCLPPPSSLSEE